MTEESMLSAAVRLAIDSRVLADKMLESLLPAGGYVCVDGNNYGLVVGLSIDCDVRVLFENGNIWDKKHSQLEYVAPKDVPASLRRSVLKVWSGISMREARRRMEMDSKSTPDTAASAATT